MLRIFVSYRREDAADVTGRLNDHLREKFGSDAVFTDVDGIPIGVDFREHLAHEVGKCDVLLAIIGRHWLTATDDNGQRRLDQAQDFVRAEIEAALARRIPVVPLLAHGTRMPTEEQLPAPIKPLAYRNATTIRPDPDFHKDVERLINGLEAFIAKQNRAAQPDQFDALGGKDEKADFGRLPLREMPAEPNSDRERSAPRSRRTPPSAAIGTVIALGLALVLGGYFYFDRVQDESTRAIKDAETRAATEQARAQVAEKDRADALAEAQAAKTQAEEAEREKQAQVEAARLAEAERKQRAELKAAGQAEAERKRQAELQAARQTETERKQRAELEAARQAEAERKRQAELQAARQAEQKAARNALLASCTRAPAPRQLTTSMQTNGVVVGAHCYYLADGRESCQAACLRLKAGSCDAAGLAYAAQSLDACRKAIAALGGASGLGYSRWGQYPDNDSGCTYGDWGAPENRWVQVMKRSASGPTCDAVDPDRSRMRVCACN